MPDYIFKTYILGGREYFVYGERYAPFEHTNEVKEKDFPFLESLLRFIYLDINTAAFCNLTVDKNGQTCRIKWISNS